MTTAITITSQNAITSGQPFDVSIVAGTVSQSTADQYKRTFVEYVEFAGSFAAACEPSTLAQFRTALVNGTAHSPRTINRMLAAVRSVMRSAAEQNYISQSAADAFRAVKGVKVKAMRGRTKANARTRISPEDMRRLCNAPSADTLTGIRDRAMLLTMAATGCRVSEITSLTEAQIGRGEGSYTVTVLGKNQTEPRTAPLTIEAHTAIQKWLDARPIDSEYIFTGIQGRSQRPLDKPVSDVGAWMAVQKYAAAVGLEHVKPHDFRRFVGTQLAKRQGVHVAQKVLGHADASTTLNNYVLSEIEGNETEGLF